MAGQTQVKTIDALDPVTLPMTGSENIPVYQGNRLKRMKPGDFPAVADGYVKIDGSTAFSGNQSMDGHNLTDLAVPSNDTDAVRFKDLTDRTGWVKVIPLEANPETWESNSLYLIKSGGYILAYLTDDTGTPVNIGNTVNVVNKINEASGSITVGLTLTGGKLKVSLGENNQIDLDQRYLQIANYVGGDHNVDGGTPDSIYLITQKFDGGTP